MNTKEGSLACTVISTRWAENALEITAACVGFVTVM
jgi:hypothetical protein